jgi:hypothetical protein
VRRFSFLFQFGRSMLGEEKHHAPAAAPEIPCGSSIDTEHEERKRQIARMCIELFLASRPVASAEPPEWVN